MQNVSRCVDASSLKAVLQVSDTCRRQWGSVSRCWASSKLTATDTSQRLMNRSFSGICLFVSHCHEWSMFVTSLGDQNTSGVEQTTPRPRIVQRRFDASERLKSWERLLHAVLFWCFGAILASYCFATESFNSGAIQWYQASWQMPNLVKLSLMDPHSPKRHTKKKKQTKNSVLTH